MINLHESMGPGQDRTRDPGSAVRYTFVARHIIDCARQPGYDRHEKTVYYVLGLRKLLVG